MRTTKHDLWVLLPGEWFYQRTSHRGVSCALCNGNQDPSDSLSDRNHLLGENLT